MLQFNVTECNKCFSRAFTLIELLIVMVVISILVGVTIPISKYVTRQSRLANQRIYIEKIKSALEDYRAAYGEYPITPKTNPISGQVENYPDVLRHYPETFKTTVFDTNSPFTEVHLATDTVETMTSEDVAVARVDYCLTYPLMLRQREKGARPFMEFPDATVLYLMVDETKETPIPYTRWRKTAGGIPVPRTIWGLEGDPINRPKAIDPVSRKQWKYTSERGITYCLTNHPNF